MALNKFRSTSNTLTAIVVWIFSVAFVVINAVYSTISVGVVIFLLVVSGLVWLVFWRPSLQIDSDGLVVQNPLRRTRIDFAKVQALDTRFGLTVLRDEKRISVMAVAGRNTEIAREVFARWQIWVENNAA